MHEFEDRTLTKKDIIFNGDLFSGELHECHLTNIDFSHKKLKYCRFIDCKFENCNLSNVDFTGSTLREDRFENCKLIGIAWINLNTLVNPIFEECNLDFCNFHALDLRNLICTNSSLREATFSEANLMNSNFSNSNLLGSIFHRADLSNANLRGAQDYFIDPKTTKIKNAKFSFPEAISLLKAFDIELD